jgi:hypothetical protein
MRIDIRKAPVFKRIWRDYCLRQENTNGRAAYVAACRLDYASAVRFLEEAKRWAQKAEGAR